MASFRTSEDQRLSIACLKRIILLFEKFLQFRRGPPGPLPILPQLGAFVQLGQDELFMAESFLGREAAVAGADQHL